MKLYIKAYSSYKGDLEDIDVKKELKGTYKLDVRRQDKFIHLALYGALKLKDECSVQVEDELYITSGVGNMEVMQKSNAYVNEQNDVLRPFDFINMLGNTTSYYVASALKLKGKNIFQISNNFTFINTLISIYASLSVSKKEAILGSVDLATNPDSLIKRVLGLEKEIEVTNGVNYQKLSLSSSGALASLEFDTKIYSLEEVQEISKNNAFKTISSRSDAYFETQTSYYINKAIEQKENLLYVDCIKAGYKIIKVSML